MNNQFIGDLLITFKQQDNVFRSRSSCPWKKIETFKGTALWITESDDKWQGFPFSTHNDDNWQIWSLGEFYGNRQPNLVHALETSADLNGHFVIFAYEKNHHRWHVLIDRFGSVHAYHAHSGGRAALGTFSPAVASAVSSKTLDWHAIIGFFQFGYFLGDSTYWSNVRIFPPATHNIFDANGEHLSQHKTWTWFHEPNPNLNSTEVLADFKDLFHQVIWEQIHGKTVAVPISGGLDSRSTLIPLTYHKACQVEDLFYFSYGYGLDSIETTIASQLADKRNLDLTIWTIQPYLFKHIERILAAVEGFQDLTLSRQACVVDDLAGQSSHILAAHWMDVWLDDMGFLEIRAPLSDEVLVAGMMKKFTKNGSQHLLTLCSEVLPADSFEQIQNTFSVQLGELETINNIDFKVKAWKTQAWSFRWTLASLRAYQLGLFPLIPFYDHRLADFFCRTSSEMMRGRTFQIEYLKNYGADLARVPWQNYYDANLYEYQYFKTWLLPRRAINKLDRLFNRKKVIERNWEVQFLNPAGRAGLENWLLTPGIKLHSFVPRQKLVDFLTDFYEAPDAANGYAASMLLTLSAWLEAYG